MKFAIRILVGREGQEVLGKGARTASTSPGASGPSLGPSLGPWSGPTLWLTLLDQLCTGAKLTRFVHLIKAQLRYCSSRSISGPSSRPSSSTL